MGAIEVQVYRQTDRQTEKGRKAGRKEGRRRRRKERGSLRSTFFCSRPLNGPWICLPMLYYRVSFPYFLYIKRVYSLLLAAAASFSFKLATQVEAA